MKTRRLGSFSKVACLSVALAFGAAACDDDGGMAPGLDGGMDAAAPDGAAPDAASVACPTTGLPGQVTLTTVGLPAGATPEAALVSGATSVPVSAALPTAVNPGPYEVYWARVKAAPAAGELIGKAYYVTNIAWGGCVAAGASATLTLTYAMEPGSRKAWVTPANGGGAIVAFDEAQLRAGGAQTPSVLRSVGVTAARDLAFDGLGNLWVLDSGEALLAYPMNTLGVPVDQAATTKLTGIDRISAMAFDAAGNLWAARALPDMPDTIVKMAPSSLDVALTGSATRTVAAALTLSSAELETPSDMAFDAAGNLWVTSNEKNQLVAFSAAQLLTGGDVAPAVIVKAERTTGPITGPYLNPESVTFDAAGNLWSSWRNSLLKFTPAQLTMSSTLQNPAILSPMGQGGAGVTSDANAFDATGGLWLSRTNIGLTPAALVRVPAAGVAAGGEQPTMPDVTSAALGNGFSRIVLNPTPPGLPIRD